MEDDEEFDSKAFKNEIETWASGASQEARSAFASQCAARALPNIDGTARPKDFTGFSFDLTLIRAMLSSAVAGTIPTADVRAATHSSARSAAYSTTSAARSAHSADLSATVSSARSANYAAHSSARFANSALSAANSAVRSARSAADSAYSASSAASSATVLLNYSAPKALFEHPLWLDVTWPDAIAKNWATLRDEWSTDPAMAFWIDWYEGLLAGRAPDWDLWHDIVLIDDEHWDAGPEAVAREIERIKEDLRDKRAEKFEDHARSMVARAPALSKQADNLSKCIEEALQKINEELGHPNQTPENLEPLYKVPQILRQISMELTATNSEDERVTELAKLSQALIWTVNDLNERLKRSNANLPTLDKKKWHEHNVWSGVASNAITALLTSAVTIFAGSAGDTYNFDLHILNENGICWEHNDPQIETPKMHNNFSKEGLEDIPEHKRRQV